MSILVKKNGIWERTADNAYYKDIGKVYTFSFNLAEMTAQGTWRHTNFTLPKIPIGIYLITCQSPTAVSISSYTHILEIAQFNIKMFAMCNGTYRAADNCLHVMKQTEEVERAFTVSQYLNGGAGAMWYAQPVILKMIKIA